MSHYFVLVPSRPASEHANDVKCLLYTIRVATPLPTLTEVSGLLLKHITSKFLCELESGVDTWEFPSYI